MASFQYFNGAGSIIRNSEAQAHIAVCARTSLFHRFRDTNVYGTLKYEKLVDIRIFFTTYAVLYTIVMAQQTGLCSIRRMQRCTLYGTYSTYTQNSHKDTLRRRAGRQGILSLYIHTSIVLGTRGRFRAKHGRVIVHQQRQSAVNLYTHIHRASCRRVITGDFLRQFLPVLIWFSQYYSQATDW